MERRAHFRGRGGPRRRVDVRYRLAEGHTRRWQTAETDDIGLGGAFIVSAEPFAAGTLLELEVWIPTSDQTISVRAEVRRVGESGRPGMGVKFSPLDVDSLLALSEYFASMSLPGPASGSGEPGDPDAAP